MNQRPVIFGVALVIVLCLATSSGSAQDTPVYGNPQELENETRLREVLKKPLTLQFVDTPLSEVAAHLEKELGLHIMFDQRSLEEFGVALDTPVTFECEELAARDAVGLILRDLDLRWVDRRFLNSTKQFLYITAIGQGETEQIVRIYPVADLATGKPGDQDPSSLDYSSLVKVIQRTFDPHSWDEVGGPGSISILPASGAIVCCHSPHIHEEIVWFLQALRDARDAQGLPSIIGPTSKIAAPSDGDQPPP